MKRPNVLIFLLLLMSFLVSAHEYMSVPKAEGLLKNAWDRYFLTDFPASLKVFQKIVNATPPADDTRISDMGLKKVHLKALYGLATVYNFADNPDHGKAEGIYKEIVKQGGTNDEAAFAFLNIARLGHVMDTSRWPDYTVVRQAYQEVIDKFPNHRVAVEAFLFQQGTLVSERKQASTVLAVKNLATFLEKPRDPYYERLAWGLLSRCYEFLQQYENQLTANLKLYDLLNKDTDTRNDDELIAQLWNIALLYQYKIGDLASAKIYYQKLINEYPQDIKSIYAGKILEKINKGLL